MYSELAQDAYWLLNNPLMEKNLQSLKDKYRYLLYKKGYSTIGDKTHINLIQSEFQKYVSNDFLDSVGCSLNNHTNDNWLHRIVRGKNVALSPIQHLLFIRFLGSSIQDIFKIDTLNRPFGEGPWECRNKICPEYGKKTISRCDISYSRYTQGRPVGTFYCNCGYIFRRTLNEKKEGESIRVVDYGWKWKGTLSKLWDDKSIGLRKIAKILGVDPITVKRKAQQLGLESRWLEEPQKLNGNNHKLLKNDNLKSQKRRFWLELMEYNPVSSLKELRRKNPAIYIWLYRHDRDWLFENRPSQKMKKEPSNRVNWDDRDKKLAERVLIASTEILESSGKPKRVSLSSIGRKIGKLSLIQKHIEKMPLTKAEIARVSESQNDFASRRVRWVINECRLKGENIKKGEVIRKAGLRKSMAQKLDSIIDDLISKLL